MHLRSILILIVATASSCNLFTRTAVVETPDAGSDTARPGDDIGSDVGSADVSNPPPDLGEDVGGEVCGNGTIDGDEACDLADVPSTCQDLGFAGGTLACDANCEFDTSGCFGCNIYLDPDGDDSLDGATPETAWATFAPLQTRLDAGATEPLSVCFKRGAEFETVAGLDIEWDGNREQKLTLRSYGDEADPLPIIHGGVELEFTQTDATENLWEAMVPFENTVALLSDNGAAVHDTTPPLEEYRWTQVGNVLTFHLPNGVVPLPNTFASHGSVIAVSGGAAPARYVDLRELDLRHAGVGVLLDATQADLTNVNVDHMEFHSTQTALNAMSSPGRNLNEITISDNTFENMSVGVTLGAPDQVNRSIVVERNTFGGNGFGNTFRSGVQIANHSGAQIRDNTFLGDGTGNAVYFVPFGSGKFMSVERNFISNWGVGISSHMLGTPGDLTVANNIVVGCTTGISAGLGGASGTELVAHNTIHGADTGLVTYGGNVVLRNNLFSDTATAIHVNALTHLASSDFNLFVPDAPVFAWEMSTGTIAEWRGVGFDALSLTSPTAGFASATPATAEDFQLMAASLAVDAGTTTTVVDDFGGNPRDATPDIGAWELEP